MSGRQNPFPKEDKSLPSKDMTGVWGNYQQPASFDWSAVDGDILRAALQVATNAGKSIGIGPALGGRGVVITIYLGLKSNPKRFAIDAAELHELLLALIAAWQSPSEDVLTAIRFTSPRAARLAAD